MPPPSMRLREVPVERREFPGTKAGADDLRSVPTSPPSCWWCVYIAGEPSPGDAGSDSGDALPSSTLTGVALASRSS